MYGRCFSSPRSTIAATFQGVKAVKADLVATLGEVDGAHAAAGNLGQQFVVAKSLHGNGRFSNAREAAGIVEGLERSNQRGCSDGLLECDARFRRSCLSCFDQVDDRNVEPGGEPVQPTEEAAAQAVGAVAVDNDASLAGGARLECRLQLRWVLDPRDGETFEFGDRLQRIHRCTRARHEDDVADRRRLLGGQN